ncbi:hypothetical protein [Methanococcoides burtonii]|uniref:Uncharacterized protein n=1 Tax=Methanococcoides burtonii (strain DSM 6242 / NBRC 107633 / OCM 468 / ACE-M) TaxID=259564 RepID=Q12Z27_METBU|nr:hypothetical protein [Methanococcoides burtonii]ABE51299.1 Hypothetical protein Mbur_0297 [Methanococcoides burtonii DSM 6242]
MEEWGIRISNTNEEIVRQFFEKNDFLVKTNLKYPVIRGDSDIDLMVLNLNPDSMNPPSNFVLSVKDLKGIEKAAIEVKGWHTERFTPSLIKNFPRILNFVSENAQDTAKLFFKTTQFKNIIVLSKLPATEKSRNQTIQFLKENGVDHVIEFKAIIEFIVKEVEMNKDYEYSEFLQTVRLLKVYGNLST